MEKPHSKKIHKDLDIIESKINALEASTTDKYQKSMISVIKGMVENQKYLVDEFEHLKKAIDLLTLQIFNVEKRFNSE